MKNNLHKIWKNGFDFKKFEDMAARHKKLFRSANLENQILKFSEEIDEYFDSGFNESEAADCYISAAGIYNFNKYIAVIVLNFLGEFGNFETVEKNSLEKMKENETERVWIFANGVIKHAVFPVYPDDFGFVDLPDGKYIARKYACYGEPTEEVVGICGKYLPSHYECVLRKA